jgi:malonyl-CoA/methylmalonyl-CoA synthetase
MLAHGGVYFACSRIISLLPQLCQSKRSFTTSSIRMSSGLPKLPLFEAIANHDPNSTVVIHSISGRRFTYGELLGDVTEARDRLYESAGGHSIKGQRIAFLVENSYDYVGAHRHKPQAHLLNSIDSSSVTLLSILGAHSVALPLSPAFPAHELHYILDHSQASILLTSSKFDRKTQGLSKADSEGRLRTVRLRKKMGGGEHKKVPLDMPLEGQGGMMLYTSGTTSRPVSALFTEMERRS